MPISIVPITEEEEIEKGKKPKQKGKQLPVQSYAYGGFVPGSPGCLAGKKKKKKGKK